MQKPALVLRGSLAAGQVAQIVSSGDANELLSLAKFRTQNGRLSSEPGRQRNPLFTC